VHTLAGQGVQIGGQGGHQGLTFTGAHLSDAALVEDDAAHQLHPVGLHAQHTPRGLTAGGKGLGQDIVQRLTIAQALFEFGGLGFQLLIGELAVLRVQRFDLVHNGIDGFQLFGGAAAKQLF